MAGLSGNQGWIGAAKQTGKVVGITPAVTPPAAPKYRNPFSGGNIGPVRDTDRLSETDSARDQGAAFVTSSGVEGSPELYVREESIGFYLAAALGGVAAPTGVAPDFTHVITPSDALAYHTFWRNVGGPTSGVTERFLDCFVSSLTVSADAGSPLTSTIGVQGIEPTFLDAAAANTMLSTAAALNQSTVYSFNDASVALGPAYEATRKVSSFELTIENNVSRQQTDDVVPYDLVVGTREITLGFDLIFENADAYRQFHYGTAAGTQISSNIFTTKARFTFTKGAHQLVFDLPSIAYEEFPVDPDPGGDPIVVAVRAVAQKVTGVTNLLTATVTNGVASYVTP